MESPFNNLERGGHRINPVTALNPDQRISASDLQDTKPRFVWEIPVSADGGSLSPTSGDKEILTGAQLGDLSALEITTRTEWTRVGITPRSRLLFFSKEGMLVHDLGNNKPPQIINTRNTIKITGKI